jgi:putative membrane protein
MISYNPKEWFGFIFKFHKADTFRQLWPLMIGVGFYAAIVDYIIVYYLELPRTHLITKIGVIHQTLGFVLSLLLAFRINSAYDRWWEGRKLWGSLVNNSRNLAIKLKHLVPYESAAPFRQLIPLYAVAMKNHLRDRSRYTLTQLLPVDATKHVPNQVASEIIKQAYQLNKTGQINIEQLLTINAEITSFTDICGACERIKNTPIPYGYSVFIKKFIFFFVMTLPFAWAFELRYYVVPVIAFVLYVLASMELIAEEIENPFGEDPNDLPLDTLCENIDKHIGEILDKSE